MSSLAKQVYAAFDPAPLKPGQQDLYVDLEAVRGTGQVVRHLERKIRFADAPTCQVLTGHRGSGKSTELWRLRHALQEFTDGQRYFVVQVQADEHMDRNDVDFAEVLIAIVRQLAQDLRDRAEIDLKPGYFKDRFARLKHVLGADIEFDKLDLPLGLATLSATIKNSPEARREVRKLLDPDTNNWLRAANDVIGDAKRLLQAKGYLDLVVIVDDMDKMITRSHDSAGCTTTEYLFVHRAAQITAFECHVVYTMPLELAYSHHEPTIRSQYGGAVPVIPMAKIATRPPDSQDYVPGIDSFRRIIAARLKEIGAAPDQVFADPQIETELIRLSGGQPTELMSLVREAIIANGLPIRADAVDRARIEAMRSYRRQLRPVDWLVLNEARATGNVTRTDENEPSFRQLLESRALLLYRNDDEWYGLHPAVAQLAPLAR